MRALWSISSLVAVALACGPLEERHLDRQNDTGALDASGKSPVAEQAAPSRRRSASNDSEELTNTPTQTSQNSGTQPEPCVRTGENLALWGDDDEEEHEEEYEEEHEEHEHEAEHEEHEHEHEHEHGSTSTPVPQTEPTNPTPAPCVTPSPQPTTTPVPTGPTWTEVQPIVTTNCTRCHNPNGSADFLPLTSETEVRNAADIIITNVEGGVMPPRNKTFASTPDGQKLLQWLKAK